MKHLTPVRSLVKSSMSAAVLLAAAPTMLFAGAFTPGNLAVEQLYTNGTSSTFSIIEVSTVDGSLVQTIDIPYTGVSALRQANNGSTGRLGLSSDKSLLAFTGAEDPNGVADETTIIPRGVGTLDAFGNYVLQASYNGVSSDQSRSAATVDNANWYFADKKGLYLKNTSTPANSSNVRLDKSFGGVVYAVNAQNAGVIETVSADGTTLTPLPGLAAYTDTAAQDFYMISSKNNGTYDTIYINDESQLQKFSLTNGTWGLTGITPWGFTDGSIADGFCAANNGSGGFILYGTTGANNYVFYCNDTAEFGQAPVLDGPPVPLHIGSDDPSAPVYMKGVDFVPTGTGTGLLTPPALSPAFNITVLSNSFALTLPTGNWSSWESSITNILVGNTNLYTVNPPFNSGITITKSNIVFNMTANPIYRIAGSLSIVVGANGYANDLATQPIAAGPATQVLVSTQPAAPTANGGTLVTNPVVFIADQYNNPVSSSGATVTASTVPGTWNFGNGSGASQTFVNGVATFTNLSAISVSAVNGATILFTVTGSGLSQNTVTSSAFNIPAPATAGFTPGNLAVFQLDQVSKNSTMSILELNPNTANQSSPVNTFAVSATGPNALRNASSGTTGRVADNDDGTLVCFTGFEDGSSATADETTINPRGAGTLNPSGNYVLQTSYTGIGGGTANQTRSATSVDNSTWYMGDKGGTYTNNQTSPYIGGTSALNIRSVKSFGGVIYGIQQQSASVVATLLQIVPVNGYIYPGIPSTSQSYYPVDGFPQDNEVVDFYLVKSGNNGGKYDVVYALDNNGATAGSINKYYYSGLDNNNVPAYASAGSVATANGGDGLCAAINPNGGFDIYYTTGAGGTSGNSVIAVHDSAAWNGTINLTSTNTLYTVGSASTLKGLAFAPVGHTLKSAVTGGKFVFQFTGTSGLTNYNVLATNNIAAPRATWPIVGAAVESPAGSGVYLFTNSAPTSGQLFYSIRQP
jgi:hypothetical protein